MIAADRGGQNCDRARQQVRGAGEHFIDYAVEAAAGVTYGFYGRLAAGASLKSLSHPAADGGGDPTPPDSALLQIERIVLATLDRDPHQIAAPSAEPLWSGGFGRSMGAAELALTPPAE